MSHQQEEEEKKVVGSIVVQSQPVVVVNAYANLAAWLKQTAVLNAARKTNAYSAIFSTSMAPHVPRLVVDLRGVNAQCDTGTHVIHFPWEF